jgi:hypothetical protein
MSVTTSTIVLLIVLALVAAAVLGAALYSRRGGADGRAQRMQRRQLAKTHAAATKAHATAIKGAGRELKSTRSTYDKRVRGLERELTALQNPDGRPLGFYRGVTLHELTIKTPQGASSLIGATATVDTAGNLAVTRRATLTRTVAGGVLFGPVGALIGAGGFKKAKHHDVRELYLMIETPTLVAVVECPADQGMKARTFAAKITTAAKQAEQIAADRPLRIAQAERALAEARADTTAVEAAERKLAEVTGDPQMLAAIADAQRALEAHDGATPQRKELTAGS